ncbi:hypothetical protein [Candidatus Venteria ishoeyi]|uniref:Uncharacterized protein n=1 Tax=Candidatus Venteria ishoeyi TaxID=1899563 RepID=A0A1H6FF08_9GAMM|nr:hypothetical protein [Candidatus Venteria ishoeyi]MDM8545507.1 hypothetical protein [Candidatus Venteria ishoeyi]SEH07594.1 Uncharacterised protein [Candidatus Venteria ishoeyi]
MDTQLWLIISLASIVVIALIIVKVIWLLKLTKPKAEVIASNPGKSPETD